MNKCDYIIGDSRNIEDIFRKYKIRKPDLIVTSPPYFNVKNYENNGGQIGFGQDYDSYLNDIISIFQKCYELSSSHATFWMVMDTVRKDGVTVPLPFDINKALTNQPSQTWKLKDVIIWDKTKNIPWNAKGRFKNHFEYIFFYAKDEQYKFNIDQIREIADLKKWWLTYPERYNPRGKAPSNLWEFSTPLRGWGNGCFNHFCPFPFPLVERIISISTDENDFVFDPFAGSGSVIAMASVMNRNSVGIDINKKYKHQFDEEVLSGAMEYWEKRKKELKLINDNIQKFKSINDKLRKQKIGSLVFQEIKPELFTDEAPIFIIFEKDTFKSEIDFIVVSDKSNFDLLSTHKNEGITHLVSKFKVNINWNTMKKQDMIGVLSSTNLYKYDPKEFYKSISAVSLADILDGKDKGEHFFSNINLNISKASEVFKK